MKIFSIFGDSTKTLLKVCSIFPVLVTYIICIQSFLATWHPLLSRCTKMHEYFQLLFQVQLKSVICLIERSEECFVFKDFTLRYNE